jgi:hypothetical protein
MSVASHLSALEQKHKLLESQIEQEQAQPSVDAARITELKRLKLKLKDEITRLRTTSSGQTLH